MIILSKTRQEKDKKRSDNHENADFSAQRMAAENIVRTSSLSCHSPAMAPRDLLVQDKQIHSSMTDGDKACSDSTANHFCAITRSFGQAMTLAYSGIISL